MFINVGDGGQGGCSHPSWAEIFFTRANFLKEEYEIWAESLQKVHSPPDFDVLLRPCECY